MESGAPSGFVYLNRKIFMIAKICVVATVLASFRPGMLMMMMNSCLLVVSGCGSRVC